MNRVFLEVNLEFQKLSSNNMLLIDDYPYKCVGNVPFLYILPQPLDPKVKDTYLLANLWLYLFWLLEVPSI